MTYPSRPTSLAKRRTYRFSEMPFRIAELDKESARAISSSSFRPKRGNRLLGWFGPRRTMTQSGDVLHTISCCRAQQLSTKGLSGRPGATPLSGTTRRDRSNVESERARYGYSVSANDRAKLLHGPSCVEADMGLQH